MSGLFSLSGRRVAVTGGAGLIGGAVCRALAGAGARVLALDIVEPGDGGSGAQDFVRFDASDIDGIPAAIEALEEAHGPIDAWINCAFPRTEDWGAKLEDVPADSWRRNVDQQLNATCLICNDIAGRMAERGAGAIVNLGSVYGLVGPDFSIYQGTDMTSAAAYAAIKGGIVNYTRYLASYWGARGVRANVVCPGGVFDDQDPAFVRAYEKKTPLGRMATADDVAGPIVFLVSDAAAYMTGAVVPVDGGWTAI